MEGQDGRGTQVVEGSLRLVVAGFDARGVVGLGDDRFLDQTHDRLEKVVEPPVVVERIEGQGLRDGIETVKSEVGPHEGRILLFHERHFQKNNHPKPPSLLRALRALAMTNRNLGQFDFWNTLTS